MRRTADTPTVSWVLSSDELQSRWCHLNARYFAQALPSIAILWSRRLTSSVGLFSSRGGPRTSYRLETSRCRREIRLSLPLFERLALRTPYVDQELLNTLAHEMIHQWQFDVLKRRPDHGPEFLRKMTEINRSGEVAVTTYHSLEKEVIALSRFAWRCKDCGRVYRRQRKTIQPKRHHCGACRGSLQELTSLTQAMEDQSRPSTPHSSDTSNPFPRSNRSAGASEQLSLALGSFHDLTMVS